ncbi:MAG TPA: tetratricopeptide repeat protein [Rhodanobacteraceae bacterium]|nr:tetratricopeptide repeat protein [Rhodanobacteraceae bacterium]
METDEYQRALRAIKRARTPTDIRVVAGLLEKAYACGDSRAAYALGTWYFHGKFFDKDKRNGFRLMLEAADHFVPSACYDVAVSYELGDGVKKNIQKAVVYYLRAMMLGDQQAITEFGRLFYWGIGVSKHRGIAKELLNFRPE